MTLDVASTGPLRTKQAPIRSSADERHFNTDHLLTNLKRHTISSGFVTMVAQAAKIVLTLTSTAILSRLLTPRDFGFVAMVTAITGVLYIFKDAGLSTATVQQERITHAQVSNLFWINIALSGLSSLIVAASAPAIAWFYREPQLTSITVLLSATFLISGSTVQHQALLQRQMRFKAIAVIEVGSMAVSFLVGIALALRNYGYWSLVGAALSLEISRMLLTWWISNWRPQLPRRGSGTRPLVNFGAHLTGASLMFYISRGVDSLLIGRIYGSNAVGFYSRATALFMRPLNELLPPLAAVLIPGLSRLRTQPERYRSAFLRVYEAIALIGFSSAALLLAVARPVTLVLLGPKWEQTASIFAGFAITALSAPLANAATWLVISQGRGRDALIAQSINSSVTVLSVILGLPFGPLGVAISFSISGLLIRLPILYRIAGRRGPVSTKDLWIGFFRHLPLWVAVFGVTWVTHILVANLAPLAQLLICTLVGGIVATAFICVSRAQRQVAIHLFDALKGLIKSG